MWSWRRKGNLGFSSGERNLIPYYIWFVYCTSNQNLGVEAHRPLLCFIASKDLWRFLRTPLICSTHIDCFNSKQVTLTFSFNWKWVRRNQNRLFQVAILFCWKMHLWDIELFQPDKVEYFCFAFKANKIASKKKTYKIRIFEGYGTKYI